MNCQQHVKSTVNISIAMATYNGERFIREQLNSIARQTLLPDELVVTDDGSDDNTLHIIHDFAKTAPFVVRVVCNEEQLGFADNFLKAVSLCNGAFIAFCDQDDIWMANRLARCMQAFDDGEVVLSVHSGLVVNERLQPQGWLFPHFRRDEIVLPLHSEPWMNYSGFAMIFRRSLPIVLNRNRPWSSIEMDNSMVHDQWICFLASIFGKIALIKEPLVMYRRHGTTATKPRPLHVVEVARNSLAACSESYMKFAQLAKQRALMLDKASAVLPDRYQENAKQAVKYYVEMSSSLLERAELYNYNQNVLSRLKKLLRIVFQGGYRHRHSGGFGITSLIKDSSIGLFALKK